ncbi:MAG: TetR-like C-terminal domain-containing protein, partial [Acidobacteriota bacterium]
RVGWVGVGGGYVIFGLEVRVFFGLLFGLVVGDWGRYPEVEAAGARAFGVLERLVAEKAGAGASQGEREALASLHWSVAHGLATLLVDGNLGLKLGTRSAQEGHVDEVLRLFGRR